MKAYRRAPKVGSGSDIEVVEIGGVKVAARASNNTNEAVSYDFSVVEQQLRQMGIIADVKCEQGLPYGPKEIRDVFAGQRVLDFANDEELQAATEKKNPGDLAAQMIGRVIGLKPSTIRQLAKRPRVGGKNQRQIMPRQK